MGSNLAKFDKARLIETYLQSQRAYRKEFELEGKDARAMWDKENGGDAHKDQTASSIQECVFATPILKPRVPETTRVGKERSLRSPTSPNNKNARRTERQASVTSGRRAVKTGRLSKKQHNPPASRKDASGDSIGANKKENCAPRGAAECSDPERVEREFVSSHECLLR